MKNKPKMSTILTQANWEIRLALPIRESKRFKCRIGCPCLLRQVGKLSGEQTFLVY